MAKEWVVVTDENGVDFNGITFNGGESIFVFVDKQSGLGYGDGVTVAKGLKKLDDGKFGA